MKQFAAIIAAAWLLQVQTVPLLAQGKGAAPPTIADNGGLFSQGAKDRGNVQLAVIKRLRGEDVFIEALESFWTCQRA